MIVSFNISTAACASASSASALSRAGTASSVYELFGEALKGFVPRGNRLVPLDLPGQAHGHDGILHGNRSFACFKALIAAPERKASQIREAGHGKLPRGRDGTARRRLSTTGPCRREEARGSDTADAAAVLAASGAVPAAVGKVMCFAGWAWTDGCGRCQA